ncbi:MAG: flavodoxin family protein [Coriobacteriales bacterium]|nr:flavodoxin family protein [Coriobacteriales bacterium]
MLDQSPLVLCIAGSPRRRGNSEKLLDECMKGVRAAGGEPVKLVASETGVRMCQGCNACSISGECVIRDSMAEVYAAIDTADAIVVASPIFFATVPAALKIVMDRLQPYWARRYVLKEPERSSKRPGAIIVAAAGGANPYGAACAIKPIRSVLGVLDVDVLDVLEVFGVDSPSDIGRHPEELEKARAIGEAVARAAVEGPA